MNSVQSEYSVLAATKFRANGNKGPRPTGLSSLFGENTFGLSEMKNRLPKPTYERMVAAVKNGVPIDLDVADTVAQAMKEWAVEKGASHFTHWFQPMTGATAEKHDAFLTPAEGGGAIHQFSGKELMRGEPDASSFPSGGIRATSRARGYTIWDPSSPAFIVENAHGSYLAIPTAFASWTGEALDQKIPLLRSMEALNEQALRVLRLFGDSVTERVFSTVGCEQEYFLVEEEFYYRRPDLVTCGRTLLGTKPPKGQEFDDHYFGSIPDRVLSCMLEVEKELYRLGVPIKTRHNEVAPGQYEIAPIFQNANIASDQQHLVMMTLRRVARKFGLICLTHEKPFAGVNGSGKHNNWSIATDTGINLLDPGVSPHNNPRFLFFCAAVLLAVYRHQDLLRISVASAGNDHRLGANEAPPATISVFLGEQLNEVFEQLQKGVATGTEAQSVLEVGVPVLPVVYRDSGDRNRTSPFAFSSNKFEFRAVGSDQSISFPNVVLNTIVAEALDEMATTLEHALGDDHDAESDKFSAVVADIVRYVVAEASPIVFSGDGYSDEWHEEAENRGLLNLRTTIDALERLLDDKNIHLFGRYHVLTERELKSRHEIWLEQYVTALRVEAKTTESMVSTMVLPAAIQHLADLASTVKMGNEIGIESKAVISTARAVAQNVDALRAAIDSLARESEFQGEGSGPRVRQERERLIPAMAQVRELSDSLEKVVPNHLWPLPTYRDMLFVK